MLVGISFSRILEKHSVNCTVMRKIISVNFIVNIFKYKFVYATFIQISIGIINFLWLIKLIFHLTGPSTDLCF